MGISIFRPTDFYGHIYLTHVGQHIRYEVAFLECIGVAPVRCFVVCRAVDVVKNWRRQLASRRLPEVFRIVAVFELHNDLLGVTIVGMPAATDDNSPFLESSMAALMTAAIPGRSTALSLDIMVV